MTDGTRQKIKMPPWHIPYLEKHNIYKLFYELARELVIHQPEDHVFFIKYLLANAVKNIHIPHVIFLSSPRINVLEIAKQISEQTGQFLISESMVFDVLQKARHEIKPAQLIYGIQSIINENIEEVMKNGWIMVDCIKTKYEAQRLLDVGILPTHVLYLISPYSPKIEDLVYCNVSENWPGYRRNIFEIRQVFKKKLIEVFLHEFLIHDVVTKCIDLIKIETIESGPKQPRILIIGPRGSGRKTQAKLLEEKLNLIYIDFEYLLCQAWISDSDIGKKLRTCGDQACFHPELLTMVLNKRLLDDECLKQGWVLVGYPFNVLDFKYIDCLETPPNRVIFLECDLNVCHERINNRKINVYTGSTNKIQIDDDTLTQKRLKLHPKDKGDLINTELRYYCSQYGAMRKYCKRTANVLNADQSERVIHETISAIIMRDLPITTPRDPFVDGDDKGQMALNYKILDQDK